jgi:AraC-like DNA-binding protein
MSAHLQPTAASADHARLWRADVFGGVDLLRAHYVEFSFGLHTHDEFMIAVTVGGTGMPHFWGQPQRLWPGDVFVLAPGTVHGGGPTREGAWIYRSLYPSVGVMQHVVQALTGDDAGLPQFPEAMIHDPALAAQLRWAHRVLEAPGSALAHEASLLDVLAALVTRHSVGTRAALPAGAEHRAVRRVKAYFETLPEENVSLDTLAREAGISPFHLCRVFRRETGLSPQAYQILARARRAKTLLAQGVPISQAALDAGFFDQPHLTRHFKRIFGVTPGQYLARGLPN